MATFSYFTPSPPMYYLNNYLTSPHAIHGGQVGARLGTARSTPPRLRPPCGVQER